MWTKLKGIHRTHKPRADGTIITYVYAWRGGPRLFKRPGTPEFMAEYNAAVATLRRPAPGLLSTLVSEWRASAEFQALSSSSKRNYELHLKSVLAEFGDMPIAALDDPRVRGDFKAWRDGMAGNPRKADYATATLARVLSVAVDNGRIRSNFAAKIPRLYASDRAEKIWSEDQVALFLAKAPPQLALALLLGISTGLREGDLLKLTWACYDGNAIRLEVGKRARGRPKVKLTVPLLDEVKAALNSLDRTSTHILTNSRGVPWTSSGFRASWRKAFAKILGDEDLHFHDARGTAITRLKIAGSSDSEIAALTGHSERTVGAILSAHYMGDKTPLAEQAIRRLNRNKMGRKL